MAFLSPAFLLIAASALLFYRFRSYFLRMIDRWNGRIPPGPAALPLVGTTNVDVQRPDKTFRKWATKYGNLFSFYLGERFCIAVGDMESIRTLFKDERLNNRTRAGILQHFSGNMRDGKSVIVLL